MRRSRCSPEREVRTPRCPNLPCPQKTMAPRSSQSGRNFDQAAADAPPVTCCVRSVPTWTPKPYGHAAPSRRRVLRVADAAAVSGHGPDDPIPLAVHVPPAALLRGGDGRRRRRLRGDRRSPGSAAWRVSIRSRTYHSGTPCVMRPRTRRLRCRGPGAPAPGHYASIRGAASRGAAGRRGTEMLALNLDELELMARNARSRGFVSSSPLRAVAP